MPEDSAVHIPMSTVYDRVLQTDRKVDLLVDAVTGENGLSAQAKDHEQRLRAVEAARWPLPSIAVLISIGALVWQIMSATGAT